MEERLNKKLDYLFDMAEKYYKLNLKTNNKYLYRLNAINDEIETLDDVDCFYISVTGLDL